MPRISAASNAAQRADTQRRILTAFGELLFSHGLPGLTMTDVARHAGVGRTAVYNYYADIEQLLISYALEETERFLAELREALAELPNPVDRLALYVRAQVEDLSRRHLPPGPAMAAVLSPSSFAKLADHVGELSVLLQDILRAGMEQGYLPEADVREQAQLVHGTLSSSAARGSDEPAELEQRIARTVRFIQGGAGARFDESGRPVRISSSAR
ncbi:TetR/AcrR family transcriptional regulator [Pseudarthrobacter sp. J75]|uniref:TetR/AcrR family transcriptional regulator n=1 Tax=unclassified Pseudarthrobacter TaxID=2647000 RepID=UPI002E81347D|nr:MULTISPECIES: TetR/AcrR family transcriptional regulator [unclassified Pseudarthrobacter]MEE2522566.1 TetR/AcrR family transcriptional regulator [Pseudarthrobacter sp. J47]MEE2529089.1 TetR/AcrR family transcriptional regulator [Pseudarthrobacter sp. J75]